MAEIFVCRNGEIEDGGRRLLEAEGIEIAVYRQSGRYYAYRNLCLHQGGPACEGELLPKVVDVLAPDRTWLGQRFDEDEMHIVCPWHSYEFRLDTGVCATDPSLKLTKFQVIERDGGVYVEV